MNIGGYNTRKHLQIKTARKYFFAVRYFVMKRRLERKKKKRNITNIKQVFNSLDKIASFLNWFSSGCAWRISKTQLSMAQFRIRQRNVVLCGNSLGLNFTSDIKEAVCFSGLIWDQSRASNAEVRNIKHCNRVK